jgi:tRNA (guanine37-N1)-methyltransferase
VNIDVFTLFPSWFGWFTEQRHVRNAIDAGLRLDFLDMRATTPLRAGQVDDTPYGGGAGMVIRVDVVEAALVARYGASAGRPTSQASAAAAADASPAAVPATAPAVRATPPAVPATAAAAAAPSASPPAAATAAPERRRIVALAAGGRQFDDALAEELAGEPALTLLCGRYEGFDERVNEHLATDVVSIGPYVLAGGELAAMVVSDAVIRKLPCALGHADSAVEESFSTALEGAPEYPHYTRPVEWRGHRVPEILLSGDHARVAAWRMERSRERARAREPDS